MIISSLRGFSAAKATVNEVKQQPTEWEKILTNYTIKKKIPWYLVKFPVIPVPRGLVDEV